MALAIWIEDAVERSNIGRVFSEFHPFAEMWDVMRRRKHKISAWHVNYKYDMVARPTRHELFRFEPTGEQFNCEFVHINSVTANDLFGSTFSRSQNAKPNHNKNLWTTPPFAPPQQRAGPCAEKKTENHSVCGGIGDDRVVSCNGLCVALNVYGRHDRWPCFAGFAQPKVIHSAELFIGVCRALYRQQIGVQLFQRRRWHDKNW